MLMSLPDLIAKHGMDIRSVLHCGAHLAEEAGAYAAADVGDVWWVEANPAVIMTIKDELAAYPRQHVIEALLWEEDGIVKTFHRTNYQGMSSSLLDFGTHPEFSPDTVFVDHLQMTTSTIDTLVTEQRVPHGPIVANMLVMDLQGVEGFVLRGATEFLKGVDYVMSEVNKDQVYVGCTQIGELDAILGDFERVETYWVGEQGWGDALWVRRS